MEKHIKLIFLKGTEVCKSEVGHRNFHYPSNKCYLTTTDVEVERLNWVGSNVYKAYLTKNLKTNCVIWASTAATNCAEQTS